ncbi:hypothetical protein MJO28_013091 [Puccinia striiformis f. sp. tritici]|uniref:Uncharacterized protein n=1 Tax=Puccinia striiformis f. sp. tritici TaxID=168172 RepID=A0ACC0DXJ4_9BASI|nr:hypothetical protein MJO28_013091 [Puccinia striiformis f. sp. tritici]
MSSRQHSFVSAETTSRQGPIANTGIPEVMPSPFCSLFPPLFLLRNNTSLTLISPVEIKP